MSLRLPRANHQTQGGLAWVPGRPVPWQKQRGKMEAAESTATRQSRLLFRVQPGVACTGQVHWQWWAAYRVHGIRIRGPQGRRLCHGGTPRGAIEALSFCSSHFDHCSSPMTAMHRPALCSPPQQQHILSTWTRRRLKREPQPRTTCISSAGSHGYKYSLQHGSTAEYYAALGVLGR